MRFVYVVRPNLGRWEVSFGDSGTTFLYQGVEEAVAVATGAARLHWESQGRPSAVRMESPGEEPRELARYGDEPRDLPHLGAARHPGDPCPG
jgi:hypothetical protein